MSSLRLEASERAGRYASFAEFHTQVVTSGYDMYGWVGEKFYQLYPGGRCIDYTETIKRDAEKDAVRNSEGIHMEGINWDSDEAVVRASHPSIVLYGPSGDGCHLELDGKHFEYANTIENLWRKARKKDSVVEFETFFREPEKVLGEHRFMAGSCVDCGDPLSDVCVPFVRPKPKVVTFESTLRVQDASEVGREDEGNPKPCLCGADPCIGPEKLKADYACVRRVGIEAMMQTTPAAKPLSPDSPKDAFDFLPPLGDRSHHFTTEQVMEAVGPDVGDYVRGNIERHLHLMTSGERYTLYRAIKQLSLRTRPEGEAKVTWGVEDRRLSNPWVRFWIGDEESDADAIILRHAAQTDPEYSIQKIRFETYETVQETRKKEA